MVENAQRLNWPVERIVSRGSEYSSRDTPVVSCLISPVIYLQHPARPWILTRPPRLSHAILPCPLMRMGRSRPLLA